MPSRRGYTGPYDLGLIYMNACYYLPEVGRFISPDTLVPDPGNPQSHNRYAYVLNSPVNDTDPSGHCINNYEAGSADLETCLAGWNSVGNYLAQVTYGPGGNGVFPNDTLNDWLMNADIATLEALMKVYGIDYGYTFAPPAPATTSGPPGKSVSRDTCQYWQDCYDPVSDYYGGSFALYLLSGAIIEDEYGNKYFNGSLTTNPGISLFLYGDIQLNHNGSYRAVEDLSVDQRESAIKDSLKGTGASVCGTYFVQGCLGSNSAGDRFWQLGFGYPPGISFSTGYTVLYAEDNHH